MHSRAFLLTFVLLALACGDSTGPSSPRLVGNWIWVGSEQNGVAYDVSGTVVFGTDSLLSWSGAVDHHDGHAPLVDSWTHPYQVHGDTLTIAFPENPTRWIMAESATTIKLSLVGVSPPEKTLTIRRVD